MITVLTRFGASLDDEASAPILIAAWLHDCLEDTALRRDEIAARFGAQVADLVWRVTDEAGSSRAERKRATYPKLRASEQAVILKLADRIANVEASLANNRYQLAKYQREYKGFKDALRATESSALASALWEHLGNLLRA